MNALLIIFLAILFSAFFSGMEIAFVSSNKLRIELDKKQGAFGSGIISIFTGNTGQYLATMLIGNNIALVVYGLFFAGLLTPILTPLLGSDIIVLIVNTVLSTALILLVGEFLPKTIFMISPNFFLKILSIPTLFFFVLFYPLSRVSLAASELIFKLLFKKRAGERLQENVVFSKVDLDHFVNMSKQISEEGEADHHNIRIFQNALDFSNIRVRECMIPRTEVVAVEINSTLSELKDLFIETRFSRIPVFRDNIDNIIGYFELTDLYRNLPDVATGIRKLAIVPESMAANKLLRVFVEEKKNIALVVDEFGGTSGMVTIEDVLEEIVGDIEDEHDENILTEKIINKNEFILSGRLEIDYLNEKYELSLPEEDEYETLAGLILYHHGSIPVANDIIRVNNFVFKILKVSSTRLELVNLKVE